MPAKKVVGKPSRIKFDYIKGSAFRVVHADGVYGGITPRGHLQLAFFNERHPIPQQMEYELLPNGKLGPEIVANRKTRGAIVRELDVSVTMTADTAQALHKWLGEHLQKLNTLNKQS